MGVFIIELIGNGLSSRAIIKKGEIFLHSIDNMVGHEFCLLNNNMEILKGNKTGVWISGRFYKVNDLGKVIVPYPKS